MVSGFLISVGAIRAFRRHFDHPFLSMMKEICAGLPAGVEVTLSHGDMTDKVILRNWYSA
ncbi:hypothetical protein IP76_03125 [Rhizobium sp. AAP43]|nr:hypothetical protein IP76_03125 [Rhizobium sp. AAP43]